MLHIVHHTCAGMDVHKKFIAVTIASTDFKGVTQYQKKRFSTFNSDLNSCKSWLLKNNCKEVCMESTGKYWFPIFNVLETSCHVVVANPKYVRAIKGQKQMIKMPLGLQIYTSLTLFLPVTSLRKIFGCYVNCVDTEPNL